MTTLCLSVGIVGAGKIAVDSHVPVLRAMSEVRIAWIADRDAGRANAVAKANRLLAVAIDSDRLELPACDVVMLAIPLPPREQYFALLQQGETAIFAEKPLANTAEGHRRLLSEFELWRLSVGYQRRQYATSRFLKRAIKKQLFGALRKIRISEGGRTTRSYDGGPYQDEGVANGGGITKNLGCHTLDLAFWLTGARRFSVIERRIEWDGSTDRRASARISLGEVDGSPGYECAVDWTVSWLDNQSNTIELEFEHALLRCSVQAGTSIDLLSRSGDSICRIDARETGGASTISQACYLDWRAVLTGAATRTENEISGRSALAAAELIDELLRS